MPRTKQNNPKNLKDKIEEAQKELKEPVGSKKGNRESGTSSETIKGIKRKKLIAENQLKKIPKSPVKKSSLSKVSACPHKTGKEKAVSPFAENGERAEEKCTMQKDKDSHVYVVKADESSCSKQTQRPIDHQPFPLCNGKSDARWPLASKHPMPLEQLQIRDNTPAVLEGNWSVCAAESTSPPVANASLDVLLQAMETDLNSLSKTTFLSCHTQFGKSVAEQSRIAFPQLTKQNAFTGKAANCVHAEKSDKTLHHIPHLHYEPMTVVSQKKQQNTQQKVACFAQENTCQQSQEESHLHQGSSSHLHLPQSQPMVQTCQSASASVPCSVQVPVTPGCSQLQLSTFASHGSEQKPKKQGKYVCEYCKRACAKPSVLLKHIRSHTGERPYPCITCGFSFKTKSNLYKHKKSHAHVIKLGLVMRADSSGGSLSQESEKAFSTHSDVDESGDSEEEGTTDERSIGMEAVQSLVNASPHPANQGDTSVVHERNESAKNQKYTDPQVTATLPKVIVYPVNVSPLRADSPLVSDSHPELPAAQKRRDLQTSSLSSSLTVVLDGSDVCLGEDEQNVKSPGGGGHAQLQRQQATDCSQQEQGKSLLSPRSLGSTDSGYFSRSESADQTVSPPNQFGKLVPASEMEVNKNVLTGHLVQIVAPALQASLVEKPLLSSMQMRPPMETKTLEERISKLISDNEAVVDDKQLDSVKPRRTSLSRRGSIDSPKSYIFKDSFQFDLKPTCRRASSSSDIPKSPFTPTDKSKQVFLLSVPSQYPAMDCLPITRSNSMPATPGYSTIPPNVTPAPHPLRGSQSFDDKIGSFYDDVFTSGPPTPMQAVHPRTLVRQAAIEDSSASEGHSLASCRSVDESRHGSILATEVMLRSKSFEQASASEKIKKSQQIRGTMYECETCRNRYRKLENFENHKKFYCSELHGPKSKTVTLKESEHDLLARSSQPQILHYRVMGTSGVLEQPTTIIRKRRKMKSVGDDDESSPTERNAPCSGSFDSASCLVAQDVRGRSFHKQASVAAELPSSSINIQTPQLQHAVRSTESLDSRLSPIHEIQGSLTSSDRGELQRQGSGISVIQHTNSLSRPSSFDKSDSFERISLVSLQEKEIQTVTKQLALASVSSIQSDDSTQSNTSQQQSTTVEPDLHSERRARSAESTIPVQQSRLVRQHNIQVPEILVTEEPDREQEGQGNEPEKPLETFNWPQRSESLSKLPTEKLPPKKKRIRLAELEHSSAESSFESTLSRSLSRDSTLSCCSSISVSFDRDEVPRSESPLNSESIGKPCEPRSLNHGVNMLGVPVSTFREIRRAASEQINCTQPSVEVSSEYRSKSFDCGTVSPIKPASSVEVALPRLALSPAAVGSQVPLIERRRGPLVRQMSLNISPEGQQQSKFPLSLPKASTIHTSPASLYRPQVTFISSATPAQVSKPPMSYQETVFNKNKPSVQNVNMGSKSCSIPPLIAGLPHPWQQLPSSLNSTKVQQPSLPKEDNSFELQQHCTYTPKYQLLPATQVASNTLPITTLPISNEVTSACKSPETLTSIYLVPPNIDATALPASDQQLASVVLPASFESAVSTKSLPRILVTQDQTRLGGPSVCKPCFTPDDITNASRSSVSHTTLDRPYFAQTLNASSDDRNSSILSLHTAQKVSTVGLFPQQESTASSKRMLSPANSLDIAMEKHQKRAKDEHGSACHTDGRSLNFLNPRAAEVSRQRKLMLVRQVCTTEPADSSLSDTDIGPEYQIRSVQDKMVVTGARMTEVASAKLVETRGEGTEIDGVSVSSLPRASPGPTNSSLQMMPKSQDQRSSINSQVKTASFPGQVKLASSVSVVNTKESHRLSFPSLKTATSFTWCFLMRRRPLHLMQADQRISAYAAWTVSSSNPDPLGLPTKVALSLFDSKQNAKKMHFTQAITTSAKYDILAYSIKLKSSLPKDLSPQKCTTKESSIKDKVEHQQSSEIDTEPTATKNEPRRVRIFDGGYKSNEEYVYVRGRGRGKYICEECGIRCKKPSMLRKHIRTHTDVRPYHCAYCNFSFKTKGNLTKHMKSKAHSKKCIEMGISVGSIDDADTEDSGEKGKFSYDRQCSDGDDSEGGDDDDNDNDEEDEDDSQAESVVSATPSVTASPQHHPTMCSYSECSSVTNFEDGLKSGKLSGRLLTSSVDTLPKALLTQMTAFSITSDGATVKLPGTCEVLTQMQIREPSSPGVDMERSSLTSPKSPCRQMSVDFPESDEIPVSSTKTMSVEPSKTLGQSSEAGVPVDRSTQTTLMPSSVYANPQFLQCQQPQQQIECVAPQTRLFSHLPMHSQHPSRTPYSMIPVGGIQLVPAGLAAYSTFVPIQAGPVQLTIPAVSVIHRTSSPNGEKSPEGTGPAVSSSMGVSEHVNNVLPCIPIGQVSVPGLQTLGSQNLQPLPGVGLETVNILGLANTNINSQIQPQGLTLNAVGLQVLAANPPAQSSPSPQAHISGLQILNIALPTIIPSLSPIAAEGHGVNEKMNINSKPSETRLEQTPVQLPVAVNIGPVGCALSPQLPANVLLKTLEPSISGTLGKENETPSVEAQLHPKQRQESTAVQNNKNLQDSQHIIERKKEDISNQQMTQPRRHIGTSRGQTTIQYSDVSSDDEDRLVIET
ncbi:zinc finger protein 40 [Polypterus senegalus]|uniref:zinc finger protein 40 n=1 Tax=Polypterus senegalus TaxID=55291 RepID=UPI001965A966|nr:zinc finger protein 40 [Polypterus senegalus]XP_039592101.1 zinc finger protein 40 [Polypterus senegalus]